MNILLGLLLMVIAALVAWGVAHFHYQQKLSRQSLDHQQRLTDLNAEKVRLEERLQSEARNAEDRQKAREQMEKEFKLLAHSIFEEKTQRMTQMNQESLQTTLNPLKTQLSDFRKKVEDVHEKQRLDRASLKSELDHIKELNKQMSEDAVNLTRALKGDKRAQGNWGEVVLERILEDSGLREGHEYETQVSARSDEGQLQRPDVVVRLPEKKDIIIDSKVSLVDYERYVSAVDEDERSQALAAHVAAVKQHIAGLSFKEYEKLPGLRSLDFVLLFIPIESAFMAAFDSDRDMFRIAYDKNIIVVSPTTLLATLRTVQTIWRYERQNRNTDEIARQGGAIHDQIKLVLESLEDVGRHIDRARDSWDKTRDRLSTGRGNLVKRAQDIKRLGARTKKAFSALAVEDATMDDTIDTPNPTEEQP